MVELASDSTNIMQHYAVFGTHNKMTMTQRKLQHKAQMWKLVHVEKQSYVRMSYTETLRKLNEITLRSSGRSLSHTEPVADRNFIKRNCSTL